MLSYIIGFVFFFIMIIGLYCLGKAFLIDNESYSYCFLVGYLIYSFFVGVAGIGVQVLKFEWNVFFWLMIAILIGLSIYTIYRIKKYRIKMMPNKMKDFISSHMMLCMICAILMFVLLCCFIPLWYCNHLDDGFYINKMATSPYIQHFFNAKPATGFVYSNTGLDPYSFNSYEIEAAFYVYLLKIPVTLYARFFLSAFNYFLLANCVYCFARKILDSLNIEYNKKILQFMPVIIIFFAFNEIFLRKYNLMWVQDSNQFTNAMYFGSSIVRTMGIMLLLLPFIDKNDIDVKVVLKVMAISVVLMSKSSIALPVIFVTAFAYLIINFIFKGKPYIFIVLLMIVGIVFVGVYLQSNDAMTTISNYSMNCFINNMKTISFIIVLPLIVISFFFKSKLINRLNLIMITIGALIALPIISNVTAIFGMFSFVMGRVNTVYFYTLICIAYIYIYVIFIKVKMKDMMLYALSLVSFISFSFGVVYSLSAAGGNLFPSEDGSLTNLSLYNAMRVMWHNKKLVPESTVMLGNSLNRLSNETSEDIIVLTRESEVVDVTVHHLAVSITEFAPKVKSIAATFRYGAAPKGSGFENYSEKDQSIFEDFILRLNDKNYKRFKKVLDTYPINCVVVPTDGYDEYMKKMDFKLYDHVADEKSEKQYYIYCR